MGQGVVRLALRVLDLVKTTLLKTLLSAFMEKISINKNVCFYRGIKSLLTTINFFFFG
jgi:hypothetical protein